MEPTVVPSIVPSQNPTSLPSLEPSLKPSESPSSEPTVVPSVAPTCNPTSQPSLEPSLNPSITPSSEPSVVPSVTPSQNPTLHPSSEPTLKPSKTPSLEPSPVPSSTPSQTPTSYPSRDPSSMPSIGPTINPSLSPTTYPTSIPSSVPTIKPSSIPSLIPTMVPSAGGKFEVDVTLGLGHATSFLDFDTTSIFKTTTLEFCSQCLSYSNSAASHLSIYVYEQQFKGSMLEVRFLIMGRISIEQSIETEQIVSNCFNDQSQELIATIQNSLPTTISKTPPLSDETSGSMIILWLGICIFVIILGTFLFGGIIVFKRRKRSKSSSSSSSSQNEDASRDKSYEYCAILRGMSDNYNSKGASVKNPDFPFLEDESVESDDFETPHKQCDVSSLTSAKFRIDRDSNVSDEHCSL